MTRTTTLLLQIPADVFEKIEHAAQLPSGCFLAPQNHATKAAFAIQAVLVVRYAALYATHHTATLDHRSFCLKLCLSDWTKEVDFQFHCREGFARSQSAKAIPIAASAMSQRIPP
jgi:hypothetical protein